jgi:hypothetical protein
LVRSLHPKEARVVQILLARLTASDAERVKLAGFGKSTFYKARRRASRWGWVTERYVPNPAPLGIQRVVFQLGWPFSESWGEVVRAWEQQRGLVLLWTFRDLVFSVVWEGRCRSSLGLLPDRDELSPARQSLRGVWTVEVNAGSGAVPVYFDFEGAWARWSGSGKALSYPTSLGNLAEQGSKASAADLPARERHEVLDLMGTPDAVRDIPGSRALARPGGGSEAASVASIPDWVHRWAFPDFRNIPSVGGRGIEQVVFVTGLLREAGRARDLVKALFEKAEAAPWLFAYDEKRVLLGLLAPRSPSSGGHPVPVMDALEEHLREVEILRDSISTHVPVVDHRYGALLKDPHDP